MTCVNTSYDIDTRVALWPPDVHLKKLSTNTLRIILIVPFASLSVVNRSRGTLRHRRSTGRIIWKSSRTTNVHGTSTTRPNTDRYDPRRLGHFRLSSSRPATTGANFSRKRSRPLGPTNGDRTLDTWKSLRTNGNRVRRARLLLCADPGTAVRLFGGGRKKKNERVRIFRYFERLLSRMIYNGLTPPKPSSSIV